MRINDCGSPMTVVHTGCSFRLDCSPASWSVRGTFNARRTWTQMDGLRWCMCHTQAHSVCLVNLHLVEIWENRRVDCCRHVRLCVCVSLCFPCRQSRKKVIKSIRKQSTVRCSTAIGLQTTHLKHSVCVSVTHVIYEFDRKTQFSGI